MTHGNIIRRLLYEKDLTLAKMAERLGRKTPSSVFAMAADKDIMMRSFLEVIENLGYTVIIKPVGAPATNGELIVRDWD